MAHPQFVNQYTRLDRVLHRLAFSSGGLQIHLAKQLKTESTLDVSLAGFGPFKKIEVWNLIKLLLQHLIVRYGSFILYALGKVPLHIVPVKGLFEKNCQ